MTTITVSSGGAAGTDGSFVKLMSGIANSTATGTGTLVDSGFAGGTGPNIRTGNDGADRFLNLYAGQRGFLVVPAADKQQKLFRKHSAARRPASSRSS
jgi:hypothetical protein